MSQPSPNGSNPREGGVSVWERIAAFSTAAAFALVAVLVDRPVFFVAAGFALLSAVAEPFAERYPREARAAVLIGRVGIAVTLGYLAVVTFLI